MTATVSVPPHQVQRIESKPLHTVVVRADNTKTIPKALAILADALDPNRVYDRMSASKCCYPERISYEDGTSNGLYIKLCRTDFHNLNEFKELGVIDFEETIKANYKDSEEPVLLRSISPIQIVDAVDYFSFPTMVGIINETNTDAVEEVSK